MPAPDGAAVWSAATARCRSAKTFSAEVHVSGRVGATKLKETAFVGVTDTDDIRLEVPAPFGKPIFVLAGTNGQATVVTRDDRTLRAEAVRIVEAIVGLPFGPRSLLNLLTGCVGQEPVTESLRYGDVLTVRTADTRVYLRQTTGDWRVVAAEVAGLLVEYRSNGEWPSDLWITSQPGHTPVLSLALGIGQVEVNSTMPASTFRVAVPAAATPLSLEELRAAGPLGEKRK